MKESSVRTGETRRRCEIVPILLVLAALCALILSLTACDGDATYTPPAPTAIGRDESSTAETPVSARSATPAQVPTDTPIPAQSPTPLPPPTATPEGYPVAPTPEVATPAAYPEASTGS